ncbi:sirohydrochlorin chelatase [Streptomyces sp. PSKA54]|uniref:Sirohydrochlorin chelatase n=1 Tax=Streptomyces himalayensis subsp. aureolus TaxID=2758039 RepID=A0A7W2D3Y0_9ACTN|nr:sirohydrochlorin chelatase [Streptomyces himalayensis]MBA4864312.1 sirohydrochlorin chelatase [Streptomyces himalayensis subsp. aureolus]
MTASNPPRDESTQPSGSSLPPGAAQSDGHLDSTAQLMNRITSQLGSQLSLVALDGRRRRPESPALVLVAHGSRDPRALSTVETLAERVRELRPGLSVQLGHIELNEPLLPDTLAALRPGRAVLVPLLLSRGYHIKQDIPEAAAEAPHLDIRIAAPLGPHPLLAEALYERLVEAGWRTRLSAADRRSSAVVLAAAGSRDPDAATDTKGTAELLAERLGVPVVPAYASAAAPTVQDAVRALAARGRHRVAVASYFTAPGRFASECAEAAPWIAAEPMGAHAAMARLVLHRYDEARMSSAAATSLHLATA